MSENPEWTVRENAFIRIGTLLVDMREDLEFDADPAQLDFLKEEFDHLESDFAELWKDQTIGLLYCLEFHLYEARRLHDSITEEHLNGARDGDSLENKEFRNEVYKLLKRRLAVVIKLLEEFMETL